MFSIEQPHNMGACRRSALSNHIIWVHTGVQCWATT